MKQFVRSVPAILYLSVASLSLIALAGCGSSGSGNLGPQAAKSVYALQHSENSTTEVEQDSVLVFSASTTTTTTATPTSTLMLPSGFISITVAVGPTGTIYIGGINGLTADEEFVGEILEYPAGSSGSATPTVTLSGNANGGGTFIVPVNIAVNSAGTLFVSSTDGSLEAFDSGFTASSAPNQYLTWGTMINQTTEIGNFGETAGTIGVDNAGDIFYLDGTYGQIDVFAAGATGPTAPTRTITGTTTGTTTNLFFQLAFIAVDGAGDVYVTNYNPFNETTVPTVGVNPGTTVANKRLQAMWPSSASRVTAHPHDTGPTFELTGIIEFAAGAMGNATPMKRIGGGGATTNNTNIVEPWGLAVDAASNLYYADANGGFADPSTPPSVLLEVFPSSATGNVAPAASITSTSYTFVSIAPFYTTGVAIH